MPPYGGLGTGSTSGNSTNTYATILDKEVAKFKRHTLIITETGATNGVTFQIHIKMREANTYRPLGTSTTDIAIAAGATQVVVIEADVGFIRVQHKSTVADSAGTTEVQYGGTV